MPPYAKLITVLAALVATGCASTPRTPSSHVGATHPSTATSKPEPAPEVPVSPGPSVTETKPTPEPVPESAVKRVARRDESSEATGSATQLRQHVLTSQRTWQKTLAGHGGSYTYATGFGSWSGFGHERTVTVQAGTVVAQTYLAFDREGATTDQWIEAGPSVGSHNRGTPPPTIDQLYTQCLDEVLTKNPKDHAFYVAFFDNGLLAHCTVRHKQCADDCSEGPGIWFIEWK